MLAERALVKEHFIIKELSGEHLLVPIGDTLMRFRDWIPLNDVEIHFWNLIQKEMTMDEIVDAVLGEYEVNRNIVEMDLSIFIERLRTINILL